MKIVNKVKFVRTVSILSLIIISFLIFSDKTYSKVEIKYKEYYISSGETLWSIANNESKNNAYFEKKDIREIVYEIKEVNNFNNSDLSNGQKILIPIYK